MKNRIQALIVLFALCLSALYVSEDVYDRHLAEKYTVQLEAYRDLQVCCSIRSMDRMANREYEKLIMEIYNELDQRKQSHRGR